MKFSALFIIYVLVWGGSCPNKCSGHGSCSNGGTCLCFTGWREGDCSRRTCPSGQTFVDPTDTDNPGSRAYLECSGKGNCNRDSGLCECFPGYEGDACQRLMCPNQCSSHGECINMYHMSINENTMTRSSYQFDVVPKDEGKDEGKDENKKYNKWDALQSFACVCDEEYEGYDCSKRKCPTGYVETNECDISNEAIQEITITPAVSDDFNTTNKNTASGCLVYAEYTDTYNRTYYTDAFCASISSEEPIIETVNNTDSLVDYISMGWLQALNRLPPGVIDVKEVTVVDEHGEPFPVTYNPGNKFTVRIVFSNQHTGRQNTIRVITKADLDTTNEYKYLGVKDESGFHGLKPEELNKHSLNLKDTEIIYKNEGVTPIVCSGNGLCNHDTGLCECFTRYYGTACTEYDSLV